MVLNKYYGDTGVDQLDTGGNPIFTFLSSVLNDGEVLADDGRAYSSVQTAENNASGFILIGPGTFNESVTVNTADLMVQGVGDDTLISSNTGNNAIEIAAQNITVKNISAETPTGTGNNERAIFDSGSASNATVSGVTVNDADDRGIWNDTSNEWIITNCNVDNSGIQIFNKSICSGNIIDTSDAISINISDNSCIVNGNVISTPQSDGVSTQGSSNDAIVHTNRIINPQTSGSDGVDVFGTDGIISKNRISDAAGVGIDDNGTNTLQDDNEIDPAN